MRHGVVAFLTVIGLLTASTPSRGQATASAAPDLPKVVLIGDSIRLGYAPRVAERLSGKAVVISTPDGYGNGGEQFVRVGRHDRE